MGQFDSIRTKLKCPVVKESPEQEIQIKWREIRSFASFRIGDIIEDLFPKYDNNWIKSDYVCQGCSKKTAGKFGPCVKVEDQKRHYGFIRMENGKITTVLTEEEFSKLGIENYAIYE